MNPTLPAPIAGADVVEFNPRQDPTGLTAAVAAKLVKELLGGVRGVGRDFDLAGFLRTEL